MQKKLLLMQIVNENILSTNIFLIGKEKANIFTRWPNSLTWYNKKKCQLTKSTVTPDSGSMTIGNFGLRTPLGDGRR